MINARNLFDAFFEAKIPPGAELFPTTNATVKKGSTDHFSSSLTPLSTPSIQSSSSSSSHPMELLSSSLVASKPPLGPTSFHARAVGGAAAMMTVGSSSSSFQIEYDETDERLQEARRTGLDAVVVPLFVEDHDDVFSSSSSNRRGEGGGLPGDHGEDGGDRRMGDQQEGGLNSASSGGAESLSAVNKPPHRGTNQQKGGRAGGGGGGGAASGAGGGGGGDDRSGGGDLVRELVAMRRGPEREAMSGEQQVELMPPDGPTLYTGTCVLFHAQKGFGFIAADLGGPDIYIARDALHHSYAAAVEQGTLLPDDPEPVEGDAQAVALAVLQQTRPYLCVGERIRFRTSWNGPPPAPGQQRSRNLRATDVVGLRSRPLQVERALLVKGGCADPKHPQGFDEEYFCDQRFVRSAVLDAQQPPLDGVRHAGWVKAYTNQRGYIRVALKNSPTVADTSIRDAVLLPGVIVWSPATANRPSPPDMIDGVLVEFTIIGYDSSFRPLAGAVTGPNGTLLDPETWELTEVAKRRVAEKQTTKQQVAEEKKAKRNREESTAAAQEEQLFVNMEDGYHAW